SGGLGGTYGGSPIGCAAALAVLDVIKEEGLVERANHIGALFGERLTTLQSRYPHLIGEIRCQRGAMIAMELIQNGDSEQPNPELTKALVAKGQEKGLILLSCGFRSNVIRFLPALTISDEVASEGLDILEQCFAELDA
ncbi:MAG: aminotransferase class III-fold pyridoxal phosphate-dependent enzyme, partial [Porticoccaceae bacterium]|nr:aminotransferase class III-fold pyridoxal phosphate-dependent enzyme [Porticoccaceae bacterium]